MQGEPAPGCCQLLPPGEALEAVAAPEHTERAPIQGCRDWPLGTTSAQLLGFPEHGPGPQGQAMGRTHAAAWGHLSPAGEGGF